MHVGLLVFFEHVNLFSAIYFFFMLVRFRMFFSDMQLLDVVSVIAV